MRFTSCSLNDQIHNSQCLCPHWWVTFVFWRRKGNHDTELTQRRKGAYGPHLKDKLELNRCLWKSVPVHQHLHCLFLEATVYKREDCAQNTDSSDTVKFRDTVKKTIEIIQQIHFYLWKYAFIHCRTASWTFQVLSLSFSHMRLQTSCWKQAADTMLRASADSYMLASQEQTHLLGLNYCLYLS